MKPWRVTLVAVLLPCLVSALVRPLFAQDGRWVPAGDTGCIGYHSQTLLDNGEVFVAMSRIGITFLGSTSIYNPDKGGWRASAVLRLRGNHTATLLTDGRVLLAGGEQGTLYPWVELYNPIDDTVSQTGSLMMRRERHTATRLDSGEVLVSGGLGTALSVLDSAELFDLETGTWRLAGRLSTPRYEHTATLLHDGRVLVVGGWNRQEVLASAELYDPETDTWRPAGKMNEARRWHTATHLASPNGEVVLVVGGLGMEGTLSSAELYDPESDTWRKTKPLFYGPRHSHAAAELADGRVLIAGGTPEVGHGVPMRTAELYDPKTYVWSSTADMRYPRAGLRLTLLPTDQILAVGGEPNPRPPICKGHHAELYIP